MGSLREKVDSFRTQYGPEHDVEIVKAKTHQDEAEKMGSLGEILHFGFGTDLGEVEGKIEDFENSIKEYEAQEDTEDARNEERAPAADEHPQPT